MASSLENDRLWSSAFAAQALADLRTRDLLVRISAPKCHRLQLLQMATEKLCKAFLIQANGFQVLKLTHSVVAKNLALVLQPVLSNERHSGPALRARLKGIRQFGREIELLSPACDAAGMREDNCEYPWLIGIGKVQVPHEYSFPNIDDESRDFVALTKLMRVAAEAYIA